MGLNYASGQQCIATLKEHYGYVNLVVKIADNIIASASYDESIKIWDITKPEGQQCIATLTGHHGWINSVIKLTDNIIASASDDHNIKIWNITKPEGQRCIATLKSHHDFVNSVIKLTDNIIVSGSSDRKVKIWIKPTAAGTANELFSVDNPLALLMLLQEGDMSKEDKAAITEALTLEGCSVEDWLTTVDPAFQPTVRETLRIEEITGADIEGGSKN